MTVTHEWRGAFDNVELNELHAEAFERPVLDETEWTGRSSPPARLGWVVARGGNRLIGFCRPIRSPAFAPSPTDLVIPVRSAPATVSVTAPARKGPLCGG
jgi:hypothetical protein